MSNFHQEVCFSAWGWGKRYRRWIIVGPLDGFPEPDKSFDIKGVNNGYWGGRRWEISTPILAKEEEAGKCKEEEKEEAGKCREEEKDLSKS